MEKKTFLFAWIDWLLLMAISGLSIQVLVVFLGPAVKAWKNRPRPGVEVPQQYLVKQDRGADAVTIPIDYLLYLPPDYTAHSKWPLVIYLHGAGSRGHDLELVRREWLPGQIVQGKQFNFILLSPQCPTDSWWSPELVVRLIEHISSVLSVDRDRVYLTGHSMGGNGTWMTASHDPGRFAAIAPLCGYGKVEQAERLKNMPIWAFHGDRDNVVPLETTQRMVDAVRKCGGHVKFTVYPGAGHGIAEMTYQNKQFFEWLLAQRRAPPKLADSFETCDYRYGEKQERLLQCRLFTPRNLDSTKQYPMLVWLFQAGGVDLAFLGFAFSDLTHIEKYQCFVLVIQSPAEGSGWFRSVGANTFYDADAALISQIVQKTIRDHPVDERRVCVTGASRGGSRCWWVAARYPELFSAVAPLAAGGEDVARAANLAKVPIWAFHNTQDTVPSPDGDKRTAAAVAAVGGNVHLSLLSASGHDCWTAAFQTHNIMDWMLAQRSGALCWTPPGCRSWQWWHILTLPCALLVFARLSWSIEQWRRHRALVVVALESETPDADFSIGPLLDECEPVESMVESFQSSESAEAKVG